MKKQIKALLLASGADDCGVVKARVYSEFAPVLCEGKYPFCEKIDANPFSVIENAKSVIVFVVSYNSTKEGNISSYAFGEDYHRVLPKIAEPVIRLLQDNGYKAESFVDSGNLPERHLARLAGLGFVGKNHALIHPKFGSFVFIGYIITDCPLAEDKPLEMSCMACGICIDSCPTGALNSKDFYSCLSYITQKKGDLSDTEAALIRNTGTIWGCDICQKVCPYNKTAPEAGKAEFSQKLTPSIRFSENISNSEFRTEYSEKAFSWRGKNVLLRNQKLTN